RIELHLRGPVAKIRVHSVKTAEVVLAGVLALGLRLLGVWRHLEVEGPTLLRWRQEATDAGGQHRRMQLDELTPAADHHRLGRAALVPEVPDQLQPSVEFSVTVIGLVEQHGAQTLIE